MTALPRSDGPLQARERNLCGGQAGAKGKTTAIALARNLPNRALSRYLTTAATPPGYLARAYAAACSRCSTIVLKAVRSCANSRIPSESFSVAI